MAKIKVKPKTPDTKGTPARVTGTPIKKAPSKTRKLTYK